MGVLPERDSTFANIGAASRGTVLNLYSTSLSVIDHCQFCQTVLFLQLCS